MSACSAASGGELDSSGDQVGEGGSGESGSGTGSGTGSGGASPSGVSSSGGSSSGDPGFGMVEMRPIGNTDCVGTVSQGERITLDMHIMFDQSLSMECAIPTGGDRWTAVKTALQTFVTAQEAEGIGIGIQYYGNAGIASSCNAVDYETPDVEIGLLPGNSTAIVNSLNAHLPSTNTTTAPALQGAINHAVSWKTANASHSVVVVLVTDGQPNACGTVTDVANVAANGLAASGVPTYVVGVISPGTMCEWDQNPPNVPDLDTVAVAGGTGQAFIVDTTANAGQQFLDKMNEIRNNATIPCDFLIPDPPPGETINFDMVNVEFEVGGQTSIIYYVEAADRCDTTNGGWYYDAAKARILLCPSTCTVVESQIDAKVSIGLGCGTIRPPA